MKKKYSKKKYRHLKKRRSIFKTKTFWFLVLAIIFLAGLAYFLFFSPVFQIKEIKASNCDFLDCQEIEEEVQNYTETKIFFLKTNNIFLFQGSKAKQAALKKFLPLKKLIIRRAFPDKLLIRVEERQAKATAKSPDKYFFLDSQGVVFRQIGKESILADKPLICFKKEIFLGNKLINEKTLDKVLKINQELANKTALKSECYFILADRVEAQVKDYNFSLYFNEEKDINLQVADLALILAEHFPENGVQLENLEYIDLRFDKIFLKAREPEGVSQDDK